MRTAKTLIRLGGCPGWSESSLGAQVSLLVLSRGGSFLSWVAVNKVGSTLSKLIFYEKHQVFRSKQNEPRHDKTNTVSVRPSKTRISLGIRPVWSESSLSAWRNLGSLATHWAHSEDSDQTGRMPRLIWGFAGRTLVLLVLALGGIERK